MPAVYDRFVADAKDTACLQRKWEIRHADGSVVEEVLGRLYFDLELNAKHYLSTFRRRANTSNTRSESYLIRSVSF